MKARYESLLQGVHEDITPEFSSYLERILNLDFVPDEYSYRRKTKSQRTYPTRIEESDILKEVLDDSLSHYTSYFFEQDLSSENAKFSPEIILEHLDRKGLNVVPLIMQYLGNIGAEADSNCFCLPFRCSTDNAVFGNIGAEADSNCYPFPTTLDL